MAVSADGVAGSSAAWACGARWCSPSRCSRRGTRTSTSRSSAARTTRPSVRSVPPPSSAAWCATGTPSESPTLAVAMGGTLGFSRYELEQLETAALLHHLGQVCLDEPDDGRPPEPVSVAHAGATILREHSAPRSCRRHHRRRVDALSGAGRFAPVGDVGPDPEGRERVRRAVRRAPRARRPRTRSAVLGAGVPLRRARARARSRWCSTGAVCSTSALLSLHPTAPRRVSEVLGCPRSRGRRSRARSRCRRSRTAGWGIRAA